MGAGGQIQAFMLAQQALYKVRHLTCLITVVDGFHNSR